MMGVQSARRLNLETWREFHGWDIHGRAVGVEAHLDRERLVLRIKITDGGKVVERTIDLSSEFCLENLFQQQKAIGEQV